MAKHGKITRRDLLRRTGAAAAGVIGFPYVVSSSVLGKDGAVAPSERVTIGCVGVGPRGRGVMMEALQRPEAEVVALCDVKKSALATADGAREYASHKKGCAMYRDFRELIARPDIDAVFIASTDHWHVLHALAAVRAGKDIYVEKPLGLSLQQVQVLREAVQLYDRRFQFGTQQRSMPQFRQACELVLNDRIGKLQTIQVSAPPGFPEFPKEPTYPITDPPDDIDYEMWLGPAPWAPYTPKRVVNPHWFHISDYALGYIAGWGIHHVDIAQWGNGTELTGPVEIEGSGIFPTEDALCDTAFNWDLSYRYSNGVRMNFTSDGLSQPHGVRFVGAEGWVHVDRQRLDAEPKSLLKETIGPNEIHLPVSTHHQGNLLEAVKTRGPTISPIEVAVRSDTICHLGDIAMRLGRRLKWDPEKELFVNDDEANSKLKRAMRSPWHL